MLFVYGKRKNGHKEGVKRVKRIEVLLALMIGMVCAISQVQAAVVTSIPLPELGLNAFLAPNQVVPNDPYWDRQWYLRQIGADRAWTVTTGTKQIIVAIIDAGVDVAHPDLRENIWINTREQVGDGIDNDANGFVDDIQGWNFVTNAADVRPLAKSSQREEAWSHGTMIASLIGAKGNDGVGMAGVAWNVSLMPLVALDASGEGSTENIIKAIHYAVQMKAQIINLSLAGYEEDPGLTEAIHQAVNSGVVVVAANGNNETLKAGTDIDQTPSYPVCGEKGEDAIIGVGGTDVLDQKAAYGNFGKRCTDLSAPAYDLLAARPSYARNPRVEATVVPQYRDKVIGTSLAAPLVSGAVVLLKSVHPDWNVWQIHERLYATADALSSAQAQGEKGVLGYGRLNIGRALRDPLPPLPVSEPLLKPSSVSSTVSLLEGKKASIRVKAPLKGSMSLQGRTIKLK